MREQITKDTAISYISDILNDKSYDYVIQLLLFLIADCSEETQRKKEASVQKHH